MRASDLDAFAYFDTKNKRFFSGNNGANIFFDAEYAKAKSRIEIRQPSESFGSDLQGGVLRPSRRWPHDVGVMPHGPHVQGHGGAEMQATHLRPKAVWPNAPQSELTENGLK